MRKFLALAALLFTTWAAAPVSAAPYSLTANGTWVSQDGLFNGTWDAHFTVAGYDLTGVVNFIGLPGIAEGNIQGSWDLSNIGFGVMFLDQELATFTGGLEGDQFNGQFETNDIVGIWKGKLESLSLTTDPIEPIIGALPSLVLSQTSGKVGDVVNVIAKLFTQGNPIAKIENIINFDSYVTPILAKADGSPDCTVNVNAGKPDTRFEFLPKGCSGKACNQVRAIVQSLSNNLAIPDGIQLYSCKLRIDKNAASGIYQLVATALKAFDRDSIRLPLTSLSGQISALKSKLGFLGDCHCSTVQEAGHLPLFGILAPLALLVARRRRSS